MGWIRLWLTVWVSMNAVPEAYSKDNQGCKFCLTGSLISATLRVQN